MYATKIKASITIVSSGLKPPWRSGRYVVNFKYCAFIKFFLCGFNH